MTCGECASFMACPVKASDEGCGKFKDWRKSMEKEVCQLCGSEVLIDNTDAPLVVFKMCGIKDDECLLSGAWNIAEDFDRIQKALALLKRIEAGDAILIRKVNGRWPAIEIGMDGKTTLWGEEIKTFDTPQEAVKEWAEKK